MSSNKNQTTLEKLFEIACRRNNKMILLLRRHPISKSFFPSFDVLFDRELLLFFRGQ